IPIVVPRNCAGSVMLGSTINNTGNVLIQPISSRTGAPLTYAATTSAPLFSANFRSPASIACMTVVPLAIYVSSTSSPWRANSPCSTATNPGDHETDVEAYASCSFSSGGGGGDGAGAATLAGAAAGVSVRAGGAGALHA